MRADPGQPHLDDLPGADDLAQSGDPDRRPDQRGGAAASRDDGERGLEPGRRDAAAGAHSRAGAARAGISASALRRHAPARDDRDGAGVPAGAVDRGRADHRARRHHPGADPGADARPAERARHGADPDHPRSRRGRADRAARDRDVCRQEGRGGRRRHIVRRSAPSLYARPDGLDPGRAGAAGENGSAAHRNSRHGAVLDQPAARLRLRAALQARDRQVPRRISAAAGFRRRHLAACWRAAETVAMA